MKEIKKLLKSSLKKRIRITEALIIIFLLTGSIGYGQVIISGDSLQIVATEDLTIEASGSILSSEEPKDFDDEEGAFGKKEISGNAVIVRPSEKDISVTNEGVIKGSIIGENKEKMILVEGQGNGIYDIDNNILKITNSGKISGYTSVKGGTVNIESENINSNSYLSGNGVLGNVGTNSGKISGYTSVKGGTANIELSESIKIDEMYSTSYLSGNGVLGASGNLEDLKILGMVETNAGIISGYTSSEGSTVNVKSSGNIEIDDIDSGSGFSGNGVLGKEVNNNTGLIRGFVSLIQGSININNNKSQDNQAIIFSGNGIANSKEITTIKNSGLIMGSESAIVASKIVSMENYGVLAGQKIYGNGQNNLEKLGDANIGSTKHKESGVHVLLDNKGKITEVINNSSDIKKIGEKTIVNTEIKAGSKDSYNEFDSDISKKIINGAGSESGVVTVKSEKSIAIKDSIINGYNKAVTLRDGSVLSATNTIFNGGTVGNLDREYKPIIEGTDKVNTLILKGDSVVNGNIDLKDGNDKLTISNTVQLNGNLYGGNGLDNLELGDGNATKGLSIFGKIEDFEDIKVKGQVTLYEKSNLKGIKKINIDSNSSLNLRIDPTKTDDNNRIIGHALYGNSCFITIEDNTVLGIESNTNGGTLNIITNGLGIGGIIAMSDKIENNILINENGYIRTDSIIHSAKLNNNNDIEIKVGQDLDDVISTPGKSDIKYSKLNLVYKSIESSGVLNINAINPTVGGVNETTKTKKLAEKELLVLLNNIFSENPYGYISNTSKESMNIFSNVVLNNFVKPNIYEWMIFGGATYGDINKNYSIFDIFKDVDYTSNISGGYGAAEYGISKDNSVGILVGGTKSNSDISNKSKLNGDSFYIGVYGETEINKFKLKAGLGYQYTDYETTRVCSNKYQYNKYKQTIATNGLSAYVGINRTYGLGLNSFLEPKVNLSYTRIIQKSTNEGKEILAIETDSKAINYVDTEIGIDLRKEIKLNKNLIKIKGGISYLVALDGVDQEYIKGRMNGGTDFDILVPEKNKNRTKIEGTIELKQQNGVIYNIGCGYIAGSNIHEYYIGTSIIFKF